MVILVQLQVAVQSRDSRYATCNRVENYARVAVMGSQAIRIAKRTVVVMDGNGESNSSYQMYNPVHGYPRTHTDWTEGSDRTLSRKQDRVPAS